MNFQVSSENPTTKDADAQDKYIKFAIKRNQYPTNDTTIINENFYSFQLKPTDNIYIEWGMG